jgi:cysteine sulfinate desulfinase/cysteine desulfurase-like protein
MLANNESGALQPVKEVAQACRERGILMHTDAAQAAGKVSIAVLSDLGDADLVSVVGHKLGAPKGIACLYVRPGCLQEQGRKLSHDHGILLIGGGQEFGRRGGTENTLALGLRPSKRIATWRPMHDTWKPCAVGCCKDSKIDWEHRMCGPMDRVIPT